MKTETAKTNGTCYETASEFILATGDDRFKLCHGNPTLLVPPYEEYGHAWIELNDDIVIDTETYTIVDKGLYYAIGKINPDTVKRYTRIEAHKKLFETELYGPWD